MSQNEIKPGWYAVSVRDFSDSQVRRVNKHGEIFNLDDICTGNIINHECYSNWRPISDPTKPPPLTLDRICEAIHRVREKLPGACFVLFGDGSGVFSKVRYEDYDGNYQFGTTLGRTTEQVIDAILAPEPIPEGVFYNEEYNNFFDFSLTGQGDKFHAKWYSRRAEFPTRPKIVLKAGNVYRTKSRELLILKIWSNGKWCGFWFDASTFVTDAGTSMFIEDLGPWQPGEVTCESNKSEVMK